MSVHASYSASIAHELLRMAELLMIETMDGATYRFTFHPATLSWDSPAQSYNALPMARGPIEYGLALESNTLDIYVAALDRPPFDKIHRDRLDGAKVTIKRVFWDEAVYGSTKETTRFVGHVDGPEFDAVQAILHCVPLTQSLAIQVPRMLYQEPCNNCLWDVVCGLTQSNYGYTGTATGGTRTVLADTTRSSVYQAGFDAATGTIARTEIVTGSLGAGTGKVVQVVYDTATTGRIWYLEQAGVQFVNNEVLANGPDNVTLSGAPAADTTFYMQGELYMTGGDNSGHRRMVLSDTAGVTTVWWPFPAAIAAGDTYILYPGCDKKAMTCAQRYANDRNFRGFLDIPRVQEVVY